MEPESSSSTPLERSVSQLSTASVRSSRGHTVRAKSKSRVKLTSQPSSSASSTAASDKSLTSFPSFSPGSPHFERPITPEANITTTTSNDGKTPNTKRTSIVDSLTSSETQKAERNALFEDTPLSTRTIPGALHIATDEHIDRLIKRHGATTLVRQVAEDLAQRDVQIANLRRRADERERALRKIILECGLSNLDLETKLRAVESEIRSQDQAKQGPDGGLSHMMNDAMQEMVTHGILGPGGMNDATIRASSLSASKGNEGKGTVKGWKDWILGSGTTKKSGRESGINGEAAKTVMRGLAPVSGDRRPPIQEDLFTPPETESVKSSSRASSIHSGQAPRITSASLASMALQLVAGRASGRDGDSIRGRSDSPGPGGSLRAPSTASAKTSASNRATSTQIGPKALMAMRRATPAPSVKTAVRTQPRDRWDSMVSGPPSPIAQRPDNSGPVEMDTIFSPSDQPPTLSHMYNNYMGSEYLTDRFGFIYDQRRKKRQREAAHVARQIQRGSHTEMLSSGRSGMSPNLLEDNASSINTIGSDDGPGTPNSVGDVTEQGKPKRWQDYLKIATFPTELLSHTPSITAPALEVFEGSDTPKPGTITSEERGFRPSASSTSAVNSEAAAKSVESVAPAMLVKEDAEPVKLLLKQLSDVHDAQQREKTIRWNEFLRKVRAERRREGEAAAAAAAAAAEARYQQAPLMIPEAKLTDGEIIGVADLGVKGKVGRAKWNEFRNLVLGGIPVTNRPKIWSECSGATSMRIPGYYEDLVSRTSENDDPTVVQQIDMDIGRTLTDNIFFRKGPGQDKLKEVLLAYARRNSEVGYCQGMNLIAANLLLIMPSTEETFWILASIIERILPEGYCDHTLLASRADQSVLRQYVTQVLPKLSQHLNDLFVELETLTFQWFLSVFTDCLSAEALFRVWDVVLCMNDGSTFLFQVALALLKLNEQQLLQCETSAAAYTYINHQMTNHAISIDGLIQASEGLRKVVKREDVEERRAEAIESEKQLIKERAEQNELRRTQKAQLAPAHVAPEVASAVPSPCPSPMPTVDRGDIASIISLNDEMGDDGDSNVRTTTPAEEEAQFGLG